MRELLQQALDALEWLLANIRRDAPQLSGKAMGNAEAACTALREALAAPQPEPVPEPYLCIKPACGNDCSGCNKAISPQTMRDYAIGYAMLRNAPIEAIRAGGVFAGRTPDNVVINGADLDAATFGAAPPAAPAPIWEQLRQIGEAHIEGFGGNLDSAFDAPAPADLANLKPGKIEWVPAPVVPLTDKQVDEIWDRFEQAPTMGYRYLVTQAILAAVGIGGGGK